MNDHDGFPCKGCERCITVTHQFGDVEYLCACSGDCESCNRQDVPVLVKVIA